MPVGRHFVEFLNENGAFGLQSFNHGTVMNDFVTHIDGRAITAQRFFNDTDGTIHTGAEAARPGQQDAERLLVCSTFRCKSCLI